MAMNEVSGGPQFELPPEPAEGKEPQKPTPEQLPEQQQPAAAEAGVGKRAPKPGSTAAGDAAQLPQAPALPTTPPADQPAATTVSPITNNLSAKDADLIEKEWVMRAKSIVNQTHNDPHRQKSEMSKVKADYIQKRFNKIIKTDEAAA